MSAAKLLSRSLIILTTFGLSANADQLILNGGFATGNLADWTVTNSNTNGSFYIDSGMATPSNSLATVGPESGYTYYAVTDDFGPGTHALTQMFTDPLGNDQINLTFSYFVNDHGGTGSGGTAGPGLEVDILAQSASALTTSPLDVVFGPVDALEVNGVPNSYQTVKANITADLVEGSTYQLRFIETDQTGIINAGVDGVSLTSTPSAPEPSTLIPLGLLAAAIVCYRDRFQAMRTP